VFGEIGARRAPTIIEEIHAEIGYERKNKPGMDKFGAEEKRRESSDAFLAGFFFCMLDWIPCVAI